MGRRSYLSCPEWVREGSLASRSSRYHLEVHLREAKLWWTTSAEDNGAEVGAGDQT